MRCCGCYGDETPASLCSQFPLGADQVGSRYFRSCHVVKCAQVQSNIHSGSHKYSLFSLSVFYNLLVYHLVISYYYSGIQLCWILRLLIEWWFLQ